MRADYFALRRILLFALRGAALAAAGAVVVLLARVNMHRAPVSPADSSARAMALALPPPTSTAPVVARPAPPGQAVPGQAAGAAGTREPFADTSGVPAGLGMPVDTSAVAPSGTTVVAPSAPADVTPSDTAGMAKRSARADTSGAGAAVSQAAAVAVGSGQAARAKRRPKLLGRPVTLPPGVVHPARR